MSRCMKQILEPFTAGVDAHAGSDLNRRIISLSSAEDETSAKIISGAADTINSRDNTGHGAPDGPAQFFSPHASRSPPTKDPASAGARPLMHLAETPLYYVSIHAPAGGATAIYICT